ncbi:MAG: thiol-activated cytolysin family protein [Ferruginibacter sp.]
MKKFLIVSLSLLANVSYAQIITTTTKTVPPSKAEKKLPNDRSASTGGGGNMTKKLPDGSKIPTKLLATKPLVTTLDGIKISTYLIPVNGNQSTSRKASDSKPRVREKGECDQEGLDCKCYSVSLSPASENFDAPLADKMAFTYPGAAYNYSEYITNNTSPRHNQAARNPIILQVSSASGSGQQKLIADPTKNNLDEAVGKLKNALPAQASNLTTEINVQTIVNEATFALNVAAGGGGYGFKMNAKFGMTRDSKKTYMSIDAKQKNYVITANLPDRAAGGFYVDQNENNKNENVFMSSVTYGRRVIGVIETELDQESMEVGVKASYDGFGASANLGLGIVDKMSTAKTSVKLLFIGGKGDVITIPNPSASSVKAAIDGWLTNTSSQSAVPIEFTFRNMNNVGMRWESVANNIAYAQCVPKPPADVNPADIKYKISFKLFSIENQTDGNEDIHLGLHQMIAMQGAKGRVLADNFQKTKGYLVYWGGYRMPGMPYEEPRTFKRSTSPDKSAGFIVTQEDINNGASLKISTDYIAMVSTRALGKTNEKAISYSEEYSLQSVIADPSFRKQSINFNNRVFVFTYQIVAQKL